MVFPATITPINVELALGADLTASSDTWSWTDITSYVRNNDKINYAVGRRDGSNTVDTGSCSLSLDNRDGRFTPRNPLGTYYGQIRKNTPIRVSLVRNANPYFETNAADWTGVGSTIARSTTQFHEGVASLLVTPDGVSASAEARAELVSATAGQDHRASAWVRCAVSRNVAVGINWYTSATAFISQSTATVAVTANTWTLLDLSAVAPATTDQARLLVGMSSTPAASNTLHIDAATLSIARFSGFVSDWPIRWDQSANDSTVSVRAYGVLGRINQGTPPNRSPLRRTIEASDVLAYWPAEDGTNAGQVASATAGDLAMTVTGSPNFALVQDFQDPYDTTRYGTSSLTDLSAGASLQTFVNVTSSGVNVSLATASEWTVGIASGGFDPANISADVDILEWYTPNGTYVKWRLRYLQSATRARVLGYTSAGVETTLIERIGVNIGFGPRYVSARQSGADIIIDLYDTAGSTPDETLTTPGTLTGINGQIVVNGSGTTSTEAMPTGHVAIWATNAPPTQLASADDVYGDLVYAAWASYLNETASERLIRLCAEDGITLSIPTVSAEFTQRMGWQPVDTALNLYRECEAADLGFLYESGFGLGYLPREYHYNRSVDLTLDFAEGHIKEPPEPTDDDQQLINRWTVQRSEGSFAVAQDIQSMADVGTYESSIEVSHVDDSALAGHASWRVHLGTVEEMRWPRIKFNLRASPELVDSWLKCGIGSRLTIDNPMSQVAGDEIDLIIEGYSETLGAFTWEVELNCSPARPWDVAEADSDTRVDSDSSVLTSSVTSSATSLSVTSSASDVWSTTAADLPVSIIVGGEQMTVTAISGTSSPQTFTVTRSVNGVVKAHSASAEVHVANPAVIAL